MSGAAAKTREATLDGPTGGAGSKAMNVDQLLGRRVERVLFDSAGAARTLRGVVAAIVGAGGCAEPRFLVSYTEELDLQQLLPALAEQPQGGWQQGVHVKQERAQQAQQQPSESGESPAAGQKRRRGEEGPGRLPGAAAAAAAAAAAGAAGTGGKRARQASGAQQQQQQRRRRPAENGVEEEEEELMGACAVVEPLELDPPSSCPTTSAPSQRLAVPAGAAKARHEQAAAARREQAAGAAAAAAAAAAEASSTAAGGRPAERKPQLGRKSMAGRAPVATTVASPPPNRQLARKSMAGRAPAPAQRAEQAAAQQPQQQQQQQRGPQLGRKSMAGRAPPARPCEGGAAAGAAPAAVGGVKVKSEPGVKVKKEPGAAAAATGGGRTWPAPDTSVPEGREIIYRAGTEPWRELAGFSAQVALEPDLSQEAVRAIARCKETFYRRFRQAEVEEDERVEAAGGKGEGGKTLARRPDRVTESWMKGEGHAIHQQKRAGFLPGVDLNDRFYSRAELAVLGMHLPPVSGIDFCGGKKGVPSFAVSVVVSGVYQDDEDNRQEILYTGQGGCNLLGNRKQTGHQQLKFGNLALVGNIQLGLPVRVIRRQKDSSAPWGYVLVFHGLYDVVEYWSELGVEGFLIYRYRLRRRRGQGRLQSEVVTWKLTSAPKTSSAFNRPGVVDTDITGGTERLPVWAVNETDDGALPPCSDLARIPRQEQLIGTALGLTEERLQELRASWQPTVEYVMDYVYTLGVERPAAPVLPEEFRGNPHAYLKQLNHGRLPYHQSKGRAPTLVEVQPVVYECGPWCGCPLGKDCPQAASQQGLQFRLELFRKSDGTGWGVRNLDMIPQYSFVTAYFGEVFKAEEYEQMMLQGYDASFCTDLAPRPDVDWQGNRLPCSDSSQHAKYVVCGLKRRSLAAFLNHSCDPNLFVQPVLSDHHNTEMPRLAMFAAADIPPYTELTWDYGGEYVQHQLHGKCKCGSKECVGRSAGHGRR